MLRAASHGCQCSRGGQESWRGGGRARHSPAWGGWAAAVWLCWEPELVRQAAGWVGPHRAQLRLSAEGCSPAYHCSCSAGGFRPAAQRTGGCAPGPLCAGRGSWLDAQPCSRRLTSWQAVLCHGCSCSVSPLLLRVPQLLAKLCCFASACSELSKAGSGRFAGQDQRCLGQEARRPCSKPDSSYEEA